MPLPPPTTYTTWPWRIVSLNLMPTERRLSKRGWLDGTTPPSLTTTSCTRGEHVSLHGTSPAGGAPARCKRLLAVRREQKRRRSSTCGTQWGGHRFFRHDPGRWCSGSEEAGGGSQGRSRGDPVFDVPPGQKRVSATVNVVGQSMKYAYNFAVTASAEGLVPTSRGSTTFAGRLVGLSTKRKAARSLTQCWQNLVRRKAT